MEARPWRPVVEVRPVGQCKVLEETNLHCGKAPLCDGWDVGGKEGCSLVRGGWSLTKGAGVFSWILYSGMQVLLPCLFNIAAVVVHL
ncbi:MAG: hypothetical protein ACPIOQ_60885 [Promethearchaeia archaeon]